MAVHQLNRKSYEKINPEAVVRNAPPDLIYIGETGREIYETAGLDAEQWKQLIELSVGGAAAAPAVGMRAKYVLYTMAPDWQKVKVRDGQGEAHYGRSEVQKCYSSCLKLAQKLKCKSIAFPLIGTEAGGLTQEEALVIALTELEDFQNYQDADMEIFLVVPEGEQASDGLKELQKDSHIVRNQHIHEQLLEEMKHIDAKTWQQRLLELIDKKGFTDVEVYQRAQINKQLFSDIRSNPYYLPQKETAVALALALCLNMEETQEFLSRAGYTLSTSDKRDLIIRYCIRKEQYNINHVDLLLLANLFPALSRQRNGNIRKEIT